ncbi:MAG: ATP-binding protein [Lysobacteraceae bacterium]
MRWTGKQARRAALIIAVLVLPVAAASSPAATPPEEPAGSRQDESDAARADRLNKAAVLAIRTDLIRAESLSRQALQAARAGGNVAAESLANVNLGRISRSRGDYGQAVEAFGEARRLSESVDDRRGLARLAADFAILYSVTGLFDEALVEAERARALFAALGDHAAESSVLTTLGNIHASLGNTALARDSYGKALAMKRANGIEKGIGIAINNLADLELESGNTEIALARIDEAMAMHDTAGDDLSLGFAESNRSQGLARLGRYDEARRAALRAAAIGERIGVVRLRAAAERSLAEALRLEAADATPATARSLLDRAAQRLATARELLADTDDEGRRATTLRQSSEVEELRGNFPEALAFLRAAEAEETRRRERIDRSRSAVLAARYQSEQQVAEIQSLRQQAEVRDAELESQQLFRRVMLLALLATALVLTLLLLGLAQHRRTERALARSNRALSFALADADKQRSNAQSIARIKADVLRVAAHDLRQPLLDIRAHAERLLAGNALAEAPRQQLAAISAASASAIQSVRNLIEADALDRNSKDASSRVDVVALVRSVTGQLEARAAAKRQEIDLALPTAPLYCEAHAEQLAEALDNLIDNAIKFGPFGQHVRVSLFQETVDGTACARLSVADRGPGLREEDRGRLFGHFQRLSARPTGGESSAGLGLALVKRIVDGHNGRIEARNGADGGAVFTVWLPLATDDA